MLFLVAWLATLEGVSVRQWLRMSIPRKIGQMGILSINSSCLTALPPLLTHMWLLLACLTGLAFGLFPFRSKIEDYKRLCPSVRPWVKPMTYHTWVRKNTNICFGCGWDCLFLCVCVFFKLGIFTKGKSTNPIEMLVEYSRFSQLQNCPSSIRSKGEWRPFLGEWRIFLGKLAIIKIIGVLRWKWQSKSRISMYRSQGGRSSRRMIGFFAPLMKSWQWKCLIDVLKITELHRFQNASVTLV